LFKELWQLDDEVAHALVGYLTLAAQGPLEKAPLLDQLLEEGTAPALSYSQEQQVAALLGTRASRASAAIAARPLRPAGGAEADFDFGAAEAAPAATSVRVQKPAGKMPVWAWAVGGVVALGLVGVGVLLGMRHGPAETKPEPAVAQNKPAEPGQKLAADRHDRGVVWVEDGVVTAVAGSFDRDEVLAVARGLR